MLLSVAGPRAIPNSELAITWLAVSDSRFHLSPVWADSSRGLCCVDNPPDECRHFFHKLWTKNDWMKQAKWNGVLSRETGCLNSNGRDESCRYCKQHCRRAEAFHLSMWGTSRGIYMHIWGRIKNICEKGMRCLYRNLFCLALSVLAAPIHQKSHEHHISGSKHSVTSMGTTHMEAIWGRGRYHLDRASGTEAYCRL